MKSRTSLIPAALLAAAWFAPVRAARADTVLYDSSGFIQGAQSLTQSFDISTPGTLSITLTAIPWFDPLKDLTFFVSTADGLQGTLITDGSESLHVSGGTEIFAHWFGQADGPFKFGIYGLKISFHPDAVSPVPLPPSFWLLLCGLGPLFAMRRRPMPRSSYECRPLQ